MAALSPTQRTLAFLREAGFTCAVAEHWNQHARIRQDLFGFIDIVALGGIDYAIYAIQATSGANHSAREKKIQEIDAAQKWLDAGGRIWVVSWSKRGARGKRKVWTPRVSEIQDDMTALPLELRGSGDEKDVL